MRCFQLCKHWGFLAGFSTGWGGGGEGGESVFQMNIFSQVYFQRTVKRVAEKNWGETKKGGERK